MLRAATSTPFIAISVLLLIAFSRFFMDRRQPKAKWIPPKPVPIPPGAQEPYYAKPIVYVPDYIDMESIDQCLEDRHFAFRQINATSFHIDAEMELYHQVLVLERNHFKVHLRHENSTLKFSYHSRNAVMAQLWRDVFFLTRNDGRYVELGEDGLLGLEKPPVLYFVHRTDADCLQSLTSIADDNTIVEFYNSTSSFMDHLSDFAKITRSKNTASCVRDYFVVNHGKEYHAVNTSDITDRYTFGPAEKSRVINSLADGTTTIRDVSINNSEQQYDQLLCNYDGETVGENDLFALQIVTEDEDDGGSWREEKDKRWRRTLYENRDWVNVYHNPNTDGQQYYVNGNPDNAGHFNHQVIDNQVYLRIEEHYLHAGIGHEQPYIYVGSEVPDQKKRLRVIPTNDGNITLGRWSSNTLASCEWIKLSVGLIKFGEEADPYTPAVMKLRVVKVYSSTQI